MNNLRLSLKEKIKKIEKNKILLYIYIFIIFVGMMKTYFAETVETFSMPVANKNIYIDDIDIIKLNKTFKIINI